MPASDRDGAAGLDAGERDGAARVDGDPNADAPPPLAANYAFVSSTAHVICQAAADAGDPRLAGRTYRAWLSDSSEDAIDRIGRANGWVRLDGCPVALAAADLVRDGGIVNPPRIDEHGGDGPASGSLVYGVGTNAAGRVSDNTCGDWSELDQITTIR